MTGTHRILIGDTIEQMRTLPDASVHCAVTSPPYWGLRDYGAAGQIGLEPTPAEYLARMVEVFREVRRCLRDDGTCWVNMGDGYTSGGRKERDPGQSKLHAAYEGDSFADGLRPETPPGLKPKDLIGMPWRLAFALQADGWWLRSEIIWAKPNPMPESVTDRPTKAHEQIFLLTKAARYYYDAEAIKEPGIKPEMTPEEYEQQKRRASNGESWYPTERTESGHKAGHQKLAPNGGGFTPPGGRNARTVWHIATQPYPEAHFATFPEAIPERCIKAGCPAGGTVLDPFSGSGTTGAVAVRLGRDYIGCELNPEYAAMSERRIGLARNPSTFRTDHAGDSPLFTEAVA